MKIVEVNAVPYGSTASIARNIKNVCSKENDVYFCYSWTKKRRYNVDDNEIIIGTFLGKLFHIILSRITGYELYFSFFDTLCFIKKLDKIRPDIVHLHILHCWYLNIPLFFKYLKKNNIKVVWTFHDCWAITGHCPHFEMAKCNKWVKMCYDCPIHNEYPFSLFDNSKKMYKIKRKYFGSLDRDNLIIVSPSKWIVNHVKSSFMNKYKAVTINNGIDLNVFKPIKSDFREKYFCFEKKIVLGVALDWGKRKGLDVFIKLSQDLGDEYQIVLVGTNSKIDKILPKNIISIHRTDSVYDLVKIYSAADIFVNPTREDTFPTVNIEALACGLQVLTYNTGGSPEIIDSKSGKVVIKDDYGSLLKSIIELCNNPLNKKDCINRASLFSAEKKYLEYKELFEKINSL